MWVRRGPCELSSILALSQLFEGTLQYMYKCCRPADLYFVINVTAGTTYNFVIQQPVAHAHPSVRDPPAPPPNKMDPTSAPTAAPADDGLDFLPGAALQTDLDTMWLW